VQQISRYEIQGELNRCLLSATFRALDSSGAAVTIRTVHIAALEDETEQKELRKALRQCGKTQVKFQHPHAIPIREVIEEHDFVHLVSDFVEASRMTDVSRNGAMPAEAAINWLRQLASVLDEAHQRGIIHGALWPNNIFVESAAGAGNEILRVSDFEVARLVAKFSPHTDAGEEAARYLSPEQIQEAAITGQADQFALGVLACRLLTGSKPFEADHLATLYFRICKEEPHIARESASGLNDKAAEAIAKSLAKSPEQRFSSCVEFIDALAASGMVSAAGSERPARAPVSSAVSSSAPIPESPADRPPTVPPMAATQPHSGERAYLLPEKSRTGRKLALAFVLGILIGGGVWVSRTWQPSAPVPVQVADPDRSPSSPPPADVAKALPQSAPDAESGNSPAPENPLPPASSVPAPMVSKPANTTEKRPENVAGSNEARGSHGLTAVQLVSDPVGARFVVDDDEANACTAPCTLELGSGRHTLVATIAGSAAAHRIFQVPGDQQVTVVMTRGLGTLLVASDPSGAQVLIDGQNRGQTPASVRLPAGPHKVVVMLNGERRDEQTVLVEQDQIVSRTIRW
jgi:serine/threonine protein kinase